ncbi:Meiotically up-regulated gene 14 protein [Colletotrichum viniferum]|nr:Meiotically up-regulated gene 14 protein [Colletotrichum viniferum]
MSSTTVTSTTMHIPSIKPKEESHTKHGHELKNKTPLQVMSHGDVVLAGVPRHPNFQSHRQWQLEHMAAAFRHWYREGYIEGMSGHISVRDPEFPNAFWTNPLGRHFGLLKVSDMILVGLDGAVLGGSRAPPNTAGFLIHASVHKARPDAYAFRQYAHSVYNSSGGVVLSSEEGDRIAAALGPNGKGCILRNHGILTVGQTVDEAAFLFTSMERSCQVQLSAEAAAANGLPKVLITD